MPEAATPTTSVERLTQLSGADLHDLCDAADAAILDGGGFGWLKPPPRNVMETYWQGVLLVPERELFVTRLDGTIAGSAQLQRMPKNNEAQAYIGQLSTFFLAPWARGHGLARMLVEAIEAAARTAGLRVLNLDVRATQERAIKLYDLLGYRRYGTHPNYAYVSNVWVSGFYYFKDLAMSGGPQRS